jgi:hypothetical protein
MPDFYRDTDDRYRRDPDFHQAVKLLENLAREQGYTPGELKQIAFKAALNLEESRPVTIDGGADEFMACECGARIPCEVTLTPATCLVCGRNYVVHKLEGALGTGYRAINLWGPVRG